MTRMSLSQEGKDDLTWNNLRGGPIIERGKKTDSKMFIAAFLE
jgi:hypothetical protein